MGIHLCASGFGEDWDGTYEQLTHDTYVRLPDRDYWICHDSWYWYISSSQYLYHDGRAKASKSYAFEEGVVDPTGTYTGIDGEPNGTVSEGYC